MDNTLLVTIILFVVAVIVVFIIINIVQRSKKDTIKKTLERLDIEKNKIASTPVLSELAKVEAIVKNEKLEEKFKIWQHRFEDIKENKIAHITDMIIELDLQSKDKDYKATKLKMAKTEIEIYKVRQAADHLLSEIKEITISEEKYRDIITKLKTKYRELTTRFSHNKDEYGDIKDAIELQFENIEKRFQDFEVIMENNEYEEVVKVVKALDAMVSHIEVVIDEIPDIILLTNKIIPLRITEIDNIYQDMLQKGYPLSYLNIEYNIEESKKNIKNILDRVRILNLEDAMFELKTILEYLDSLFEDFSKEKTSRDLYDDNILDFGKKLASINEVVGDIYSQMDDIKGMYGLTDDDIKDLNDVKLRLKSINKTFAEIDKKLQSKKEPYSKLVKELEILTTVLSELEDELDKSLKSLGSFYEDEQRAREQLVEIRNLLSECKLLIRSYKIPVITKNYFVELQEANEAIFEIIKELSKKPITIKTLNTRVDTGRDLVLKLYNTTNDMIKSAQLAEMTIVYGNRYRSNLKEIDRGLTTAENLFYKGEYKRSLEISLDTIEIIDKSIHNKINEYSRKQI